VEFHLKENGIDSLSMGLSFYNKYLNYVMIEDLHTEIHTDEFSKDSYLKLSVICIHNAIEILTKDALSQLNELLIYRDLPSDLLDTLLKSKKEGVQLHNLLISNNIEVKTIEYVECINRIDKLYSIKDSFYVDLIELGYIRNKITHFGISKKSDYHKVINVLNNALTFIVQNYLEVKQDFLGSEEDTVENNLANTLFTARVTEKQLWKHFSREKLEDTLEHLQVAAQIYNNKVDKEVVKPYVDIDMICIDIDNSDEITIYTQSIPWLDSTIFYIGFNDEMNLLLFVIDHTENEVVYISDGVTLYNGNPFYKKTWIKNKKFKKSNYEGLARLFSKLHNQESLIYTK
jgi:hypothetical protein